MRLKSTILAVIFLLLMHPADSFAAAFEQLATGTASVSLGSAVTAFPEGSGAMAVHYNPASLSKLGTRFDNMLLYGRMRRTVEFTQAIDPETGQKWAPFGGWFNEGKDPLDGAEGRLASEYIHIPYIHLAVPYLGGAGMGISYQPPDPESKWTFGFGQYAPFAVGLKHDESDPLSFLGQKACFIRFVLAAPAIAYKLTDTLSVGVSVGFGGALFDFETNMRSPNTMVALTGALGEATEGLEIPIVSELTLPPPWFNGGMTPYSKVAELQILVEDYFTTSYNLGLLWEPAPWFAFGICYQSESESQMEGTYEFAYGHEFQRTVAYLGRSPLTIITSAIFDLPNQAVPTQEGTATVDMTWPSRLQLGVKIKPIKQVTFTCDAHWTDWEEWPTITINFDQKIQLLRFVRMLGYTGGPSTLIVDLGLENTWHLSYGLEIRPVKKFALRFGYERRPTSVPDEKWGPLNLSDMKLMSAGLHIIVEDHPKPKPGGLHELLHQIQHPTEIEICVMHLKFDKKHVGYNESTSLNSTDFTKIVYNPYAGLEIDQEMSAWTYSLNQVFRW